MSGAVTFTLPGGVALTLSAEQAEALVDQVVALAAERGGAAPASPFMTVAEAGAFLNPANPERGRRRVYELRQDGRLTRHGDGRRALVDRAELDRLVRGG